MKNLYKQLVMLSVLFISTVAISQKLQSDFINYQAVAKDADGALMTSAAITVQLALKFGAPEIAAAYVEDHGVTTDASGVFSLQIGNGTAVSGDYSSLDWNGLAPFLTVSINGVAVGTTEMQGVPFALSSGDKQFILANGNNIRNRNTGNVGIGVNNPTAKLDVNGDLKLQLGAAVNEFSTDGALTGNSSNAVPTESAVKSYVDNTTASKTFWSLKGNHIRSTNRGNVGIGETDPTGKLHITKGFNNSSPFLTLESQSGDRANIRFSKSGTTDIWDQIIGIRTDDASATMSYYFNSNHVMTLRGDKKVGINTFNPTATLDVNGDINTSGELHTNATGNANMLPIAMGNVKYDASIAGGTGNFSVTRRFESNSGNDDFIYTISVNDKVLSPNNTLLFGTKDISVDYINGKAELIMYKSSPTASADNFGFVMYQF